jgi:hypothetical protein
VLFIPGHTAVGGFSTMSVLIEDIHRNQAVTASVAFNLMLCLMGAGATRTCRSFHNLISENLAY